MSYILRHHLNTLIQAFLACQESQPALSKISRQKLFQVSIDAISPGKTPTIDALRNEPRVLVTAMVRQDARKFLTPRKALE
jgi:hypothetical protein